MKAAYEIGAAYLARGKSEEALEAFAAFLKEEGFRAETDEAKRDLAERLMTATFQVGQILQGQEKFDEAIAAWKGYLAKFPNGPQSADAQRAILDTQLLIAADHLRREQLRRGPRRLAGVRRPEPARRARAAGPLPVGESFQTEKKSDEAIAAWEPLLSKFPGASPPRTPSSDRRDRGDREGRPRRAIERFKKIAVEPWQSQAQQRIAVMEAKALAVITPRTFRSGETPHLKITTRNLETLTFTAYKLNPEAYFRKKHVLGNVESLDIGLVAPDAEWTVAVPGYAKYKPIETDYDLQGRGAGRLRRQGDRREVAPGDDPGVGSDLDAIVKTSRDQVLVFAQDMKTGQGRPGARVLVSDGDGDRPRGEDRATTACCCKTWDKPREAERAAAVPGARRRPTWPARGWACPTRWRRG